MNPLVRNYVIEEREFQTKVARKATEENSLVILPWPQIVFYEKFDIHVKGTVMNLKVQVKGVYQTNHGFMVALKPKAEEGILPIFISRSQAQSIEMALSEKEPPRPLTHDTFLQVIEDQDLEIESVTIDDLLKNTFTAELRLVRKGEIFPYDVRPSDAIALAVRRDSDIYVSGDVMDRAGRRKEDRDEDSRKLALERFQNQNRE